MAAVLTVGKGANMDYAAVEAGAQYICSGCLAVKGMVTVDLDIFGSSGYEREKKILRICCLALSFLPSVFFLRLHELPCRSCHPCFPSYLASYSQRYSGLPLAAVQAYGSY